MQALILANGSYGDRMRNMCKQANYDHEFIRYKEEAPLDMDVIEEYLKENGTKLTY
jgi:aspartate aminotransferase-like enzyme